MPKQEWLKYIEVSCVGCGAFGAVYLVDGNESKGGPHGRFVIKKVPVTGLSPKELRDAVNEIYILRMLDHPNVINYLDHYVCPDGFLNIVMEYCPGGDLNALIETQKQGGDANYFREEQVMYLAFQLLQALKYVHSVQILHRDLKPGNVLLGSEGRIKVCDFGISKRLIDTVHARTVVGTPFYLAPEICESRPYGSASDVWAAGCVVYELAALRRAFEAHNLLAAVRSITAGAYPPLPAHYSPALHALVARMLTPAPSKRPNVDAILAEFFIVPVPKKILEEFIEREEPDERPAIAARESPRAPVPALCGHPQPSPACLPPIYKSAFPNRRRDINRSYSKWAAHLNCRPPAGPSQDHKKRQPPKPPCPTQLERRRPSHSAPAGPPNPSGVLRSAPGVPRPKLPSPRSAAARASSVAEFLKGKARVPRNAPPELEFCLLPHQRDLFLRKHELEAPPPPPPVMEPPDMDDAAEDGYEFEFEPEPLEEPGGSSPDDVERPVRTSLRGYDLTTAALCKSIDDETELLARDFQQRCLASGDRSPGSSDADDA